MREAARAFANFGEDFSRGELLETASEFQITKDLREPGRILELFRQPWSYGAHRSEAQRTPANIRELWRHSELWLTSVSVSEWECWRMSVNLSEFQRSSANVGKHVRTCGVSDNITEAWRSLKHCRETEKTSGDQREPLRTQVRG